jgi:hypothetical protein
VQINPNAGGNDPLSRVGRNIGNILRKIIHW